MSMIEEGRKHDELRKAMDELYDRIEIPDSTESWKRVQVMLIKRKRRRRWIRRLGYAAAIFACSLILSLGLNMNTQGVYSFAGLFKNVRDSVVEIFHERSEATNAPDAALTPPPDDGQPGTNNGFMISEVSLEEALEQALFIRVPSSPPDQWSFRRVRMFQTTDTEVGRVFLEYSGPNGEMISIEQRLITGESDGLKTEMPLDSGEYKDVNINGNTGILLRPTSGSLHLEWLTEDRVLIHLFANIPEEDLIAFARSM